MPHAAIRIRTAFLTALCLSLLIGPSASGQTSDAAREAIRIHVENIRAGMPVTIAGADIASKEILPSFYEKRSFRPAWGDQRNRTDLLAAIDSVFLDGLDPQEYHRAELDVLLHDGDTTPQAVANLDVLLTDALVRLGYHLIVGRVDPVSLDSNWNLTGDLEGFDAVTVIDNALSSQRLAEVIDQYKPSHPLYLGLKKALADYRDLADDGGWDTVPEIGKLEVGDSGPGVPALRRRLAATGELAPGASLTSTTFDSELQEAVKRFQVLHGLNADGVIGSHTLAAMNVPIQDRIDQMRVNLERGRWILRNLGDDFVAVNIAAFRVYVVKGGKPAWTSRVVVGKLHHNSPVFKDDMEYVVLNPTWTVPSSIARGEFLPHLRKDPGYLASKHMVLLDNAGHVVDPASVDLSPGAGFPYVIRQEPGPWNALGQVKFIFPNKHNVYLHDTPSRSLFEKEVRAFSHGCIRVENPLDLAEVLLADQEGWDRAAIDAAIASEETTTVYLDERLPVLILYWTAWVNPDGELKFYDDVYDRDGAILEAMDTGYSNGD